MRNNRKDKDFIFDTLQDISENEYDNAVEDQMYTMLFFRQLEKGEIWINETISSATVSRINMNLNYLNEKKDIEIIKMYINSRGGSLFDSLACADFIRTTDKPVHTYATGVAMSGALLLFVAGDYRYAYPFSTFMAHDQRLEYINGSRDIIRKELVFQDSLNTKMIGFLEGRTGLDKKEWEKYMMSDSEVYIDAVEAVEIGIANEIIEHKKGESND